MQRRAFLTGLAALAAIGSTRAQQRAVPRVGVTLAGSMPNPLMRAFQQAMRELGYNDGQNVRLEFRSAEGRTEKFSAIADELVRMKCDVIVAGGGAPAVRAAMKATSTIPIVFPASSDPVGEGLVKSLTRPGGNVTGLSNLNAEVFAKRVQLLKEVQPKLQRLMALQDPAMRSGADQVGITRNAAQALGMQVQVLSVGRQEDYEAAFESAKKAGAEGLIVLPSSSFTANSPRLVQLAAKHRLIAIWEHRLYVDAGGLISYGADFTDLYRAAAGYVDRILKGARPGDLPIQQATRLELVVNLKAAKAMGIAVPGRLLVRADQVIE